MAGRAHRLVIALSDVGELRKICRQLVWEGYEICGATTDGYEVVRLVRCQRPELLMLDLELKGYDGLEILEQIKRREPQMKCLALCTAGDDTMARALSRGASYVLHAPYSNRMLLEKVREMLTPPEVALSDEEMRESFRAVLTNLHAPTHLKGYRYMMDALCIVMKEEGVLQSRRVVKRVYGVIAQKHDATASQVERAMRAVTQKIFEKTPKETLERYLPQAEIKRGQITNSRFLEAVTSYVRWQKRRALLADWWWR